MGIARSSSFILLLTSLAFAQAGTRTRTVVLDLQKKGSRTEAARPVFVARSQSLGFEVTSRKGVQVKAIGTCSGTITPAFLQLRALARTRPAARVPARLLASSTRARGPN